VGAFSRISPPRRLSRPDVFRWRPFVHRTNDNYFEQHRRETQNHLKRLERVFQTMGLSPEEAQEKFGFLLDAFAFGAPPHGGIAFGWDRIVALLAGADSIREVIAFPKSGGGVDPLTDAPAPITDAQRKEAGVDATPEPREQPEA